MGQRVNIILIVEDKEENKKVTVYHDQWGIGRKSLLNLLSIHHAFYNKGYNDKFIEVVNLDPKRSDVYNEYEFYYDKENVQKENDIRFPFENFLVPKWIGEFINSHCDNNNGAMVVYVKEKKTDNPFMFDYDFKYGFLLGSEDAYHVYEWEGKDEVCNEENKHFGDAFSRWLTLDEWCGLDINKTYADEEFKEIIQKYATYFEFETF